jgi:hypothetical protein
MGELAAMINHKRRNRLFILLIFGMTAIPFGIAWMLGGNAPFIKGKTNKGQLIIPVITTKRSDFTAIEPFSAANMGELTGHWLMVIVIPDEQCNAVCLEAIHKTRQLLLMMNKDLTRIRRVALFLKDFDLKAANLAELDDNVLIKVKPSPELGEKITRHKEGNIPDGLLLLMDPLGNVMMQYEPGFDPYKVKSDLMHLLRISQIG